MQIGTTGHAVNKTLNEALQEWAGANMKTVKYIKKGFCCDTEMYSAIAADVPIPSDPSTLFNEDLFSKLNVADKVLSLYRIMFLAKLV